jgi:hypothetical protein
MPAYDAIRGEILRLADRDLDRYDFVREVTARQPPRPAAEEQPGPGEAVRLPGRRLRARRPRTPLAARGDAVRSDRRLSLGRDTDATGVCTSPLHG